MGWSAAKSLVPSPTEAGGGLKGITASGAELPEPAAGRAFQFFSEKSEKGDMGVTKSNGTPTSSILMGFSIINHPFWGTTIFGNIHMVLGNSAGDPFFGMVKSDTF